MSERFGDMEDRLHYHHQGGDMVTQPSTSGTLLQRPRHHHQNQHRGQYHQQHNRHSGQHHRPVGGVEGKPKHSVHWFRRGLRLSDNPALLRAVKMCNTWRCIYILDPWFAGSSNQGVNKWRFLLQSLEDLDRSLRKLNSRLYVVRGQPADVLPQLFREWNTTYFTFEEDPEPYGQVRDKNIVAMCKELGITVVKETSHTLYNLETILDSSGGKPPLTYRQFVRAVLSLRHAPPAPAPALNARMLGAACDTPVSQDHDEKWAVPSLSELGFDMDNLLPPAWVGGETEALHRLERHLERKAWVASFGRPKMTSQSLLASTTGLSPYLRFGCLSPRLFYHALGDLYRKVKKDDPPLSLYGQLLWREFFYTAATRNPNFDRMYGNPICVQIPWDRNAEALAKWAGARTGFPWIDAAMTQLREEGWIHHLARHAVACFLTRGDLWISWEEGMKVFDELLLDADWSVNAGTWMWLSCSSFFQQFLHVHCPVRLGRKIDPSGDYVRRYLPVLKNLPTRYVHEPWSAPEQVQQAAKCVVGQDYPAPMVDHAAATRVNQDRLRQVYQRLATYRNAKSPDGVPKNQQKKSSENYQRPFIFLPPLPEIPPNFLGPYKHHQQQQDERLIDQSHLASYQMPPPAPAAARSLPNDSGRNGSASFEQAPLCQPKQNLRECLMPPSSPPSEVAAMSMEETAARPGAAAAEQDVDLLTPSISSYQPQVVRETLRADAELERREGGGDQRGVGGGGGI